MFKVDDVGQCELTMLENLEETAVNENLKQRFNSGRIYSSIGSVVVAINPYKNFDIYGSEYVELYSKMYQYELPPHIYGVASSACRELKLKQKDQCVIISGESGAGKTETSKLVMKYIAAVSNSRNVEKIQSKLMSSNPCLEALGNAKTLRNDNSSRFGKYIDLQFGSNGNALGGNITTYLLEKARVVNQSGGERNFHIFYQILKGADDSLLKSLKLSRDPLDYKYLSTYSDSISKGIDDITEFKIVRNAMRSIGISFEQEKILFEVLAAVLHLGNIQFSDDISSSGCSTASESSALSLQIAAELLGLKAEVLLASLTTKVFRDMTKGNERNDVRALLTAERASYVCHALSKGLYERFFNWFIKLVNQNINSEPNTQVASIGVLDIYGFENFQRNSFEQFCINYTNERLQQVFIQLILKTEQEEYAKEGLEWIPVKYFDNEPVVVLIEGKPIGIISLLDEECLRPGDTSDKTFLLKLNQKVSNNAHFDSKEKSPKDATLVLEVFRINHYAGEVNYNIEGFLEKNMDLLSKDLLIELHGSSKSYFSEVFPEKSENIDLKRPETLGSQFRTSIQQLMDNLYKKTPYYVRCIKPNLSKQAEIYEDHLVLNQIRYLGLIENIKVKRAGYSFRMNFEDFILRFNVLLGSSGILPKFNAGVCREILKACGFGSMEFTEFVLGKTKIFIKNPKTISILEEKREIMLGKTADKIRKVYLAFITRKKFLALRRSIIKFQSIFRMHNQRQRFLLNMHKWTIVTKVAKGFVQRRRYQALLKRQPGRAGPKIKAFIISSFRKNYIMKLRQVILKAGKRWARVKYPKALKIVHVASLILIKAYKLQQAKIYRQQVMKSVPVLSRFMLVSAAKLYLRSILKCYHETKSGFQMKWPAKFPSFNHANDLIQRIYQRTHVLTFRTSVHMISRWYIVCSKRKYLYSLISLITSTKNRTLIEWPQAKSSVQDVNSHIRKYFLLVESRKYLKSLSEGRKQLLQLKMIASDAFKGRKLGYEAGVSAPFYGRYLDLSNTKLYRQISKVYSANEIETMTFEVKKFHASGRYATRVFLLTSKFLYILDVKYFFLKDKISLDDLVKVTLSNTADGSFVLHFKDPKKRDCLYRTSNSQRSIELAARIKYHNKACELACSQNAEMKNLKGQEIVPFGRFAALNTEEDLNGSSDSLWTI